MKHSSSSALSSSNATFVETQEPEGDSLPPLLNLSFISRKIYGASFAKKYKLMRVFHIFPLTMIVEVEKEML